MRLAPNCIAAGLTPARAACKESLIAAAIGIGLILSACGPPASRGDTSGQEIGPAPSRETAPPDGVLAATVEPSTESVESTDNAGAPMVLVPAGEFTMGSNPSEPYFWGAEAPRHTVLLGEFLLHRTEVTNRMYRGCVEAKACPAPAKFSSRTHPGYYESKQYDEYPVVYVSYGGASAYCRWVGARLPTEAEWEKAARGTDGRLFPWGNEALTGTRANFCDVGCPNPDPAEIEDDLDDGYRDLARVGTFPSGVSPYGLDDMAGNAIEWVADWMDIGYYLESPYETPLGPSGGTRRVVRGGSWISGRSGLRTVARASLNPGEAFDTLGFRCAK